MQALCAEMQIICPQVDGKFYFLDENNFSDKDLLMRLTPPDPSQALHRPDPKPGDKASMMHD